MALARRRTIPVPRGMVIGRPLALNRCAKCFLLGGFLFTLLLIALALLTLLALILALTVHVL